MRSLSTYRPPQPLRVNGDRIQLQQLLINLVINAMDAMANTSVAARKVTLQLSRVKSGNVEIAVIDGGHGIEAGVETGCSIPSSLPSQEGSGLDCRSRGRLPKRMLAVSAPKTIHRAGAIFRVTLPGAQEDPLLRRPLLKHRKQARYDGPGPDRSLIDDDDSFRTAIARVYCSLPATGFRNIRSAEHFFCSKQRAATRLHLARSAHAGTQRTGIAEKPSSRWKMRCRSSSSRGTVMWLRACVR